MPHSPVLRVGSLDSVSNFLCALCASALNLSFLTLATPYPFESTTLFIRK